MEKQSIKTFNYEGNAITFNNSDGVTVNATEMANNQEMINTHAMLCEQIRDKIKSRIDEQLNELNISHL
jgi:hypothetical protein